MADRCVYGRPHVYSTQKGAKVVHETLKHKVVQCAICLGKAVASEKPGRSYTLE